MPLNQLPKRTRADSACLLGRVGLMKLLLLLCFYVGMNLLLLLLLVLLSCIPPYTGMVHFFRLLLRAHTPALVPSFLRDRGPRCYFTVLFFYRCSVLCFHFARHPSGFRFWSLHSPPLVVPDSDGSHSDERVQSDGCQSFRYTSLLLVGSIGSGCALVLVYRMVAAAAQHRSVAINQVLPSEQYDVTGGQPNGKKIHRKLGNNTVSVLSVIVGCLCVSVETRTYTRACVHELQNFLTRAPAACVRV